MNNPLYTRFRGIIEDPTAPFEVSDTRVLSYLDQAIDVYSMIAGRNYYEEVTITAQNVTDQEFDLQHPIQSIQKFYWDKRWWEIKSGKTIRMIRPDVLVAGQKLIFEYKGQYIRFEGDEQRVLDIPREAEDAVIMYALAVFAQELSQPDATGTVGIIKSEAEENMRREFAGLSGSADFASPKAIMGKAISMMRNTPQSEVEFFSVQL